MGPEVGGWHFVHPSYPESSYRVGSFSRLAIEVSSRTQERVSATVFSAEPQSRENLTYEYHLRFPLALKPSVADAHTRAEGLNCSRTVV